VPSSSKDISSRRGGRSLTAGGADGKIRKRGRIRCLRVRVAFTLAYDNAEMSGQDVHVTIAVGSDATERVIEGCDFSVDRDLGE
jgi:hypothetical protein